MSLFSVGGNIGYALGALVTTPIVIAFGLTGGLLLMIPGFVVAAMLLALTPFLLTFEPGRAERGRRASVGGRDRPGPMTLLLLVVAFRSVAWFGLLTFIPLWEVSLGHSKSLRRAPAGADAGDRGDRDARSRARSPTGSGAGRC